MTLTTLAEKMIKNQPFTADTRRDYQGYYDRAIRPILGTTPVADLDDARVLAWLKEVIATQPASQVLPIVGLMRKLLNLAVKRRHLKRHCLQHKALRATLQLLGFSRITRSGSRTYMEAAYHAPGGGQTSFLECATEWMQHSTPDRMLREERSLIMTTIWLPAFGSRAIGTIDRLDILKVTIPMQQAGRLPEAYQALSILRLFFRDMILAGRISANPARMPTLCLNIPSTVPGVKERDRTNAKQRLFALLTQPSQTAKEDRHDRI